MRNFPRIALTILAVLVLSSGGLLVTHAVSPIGANSNGNQNGPTSQALSMSLTGGVASAGNQQYFIQQNGPALEAVINNDLLVSSSLTYTLNAQQLGLTTTGFASIQLTGQDYLGSAIKVSGNLQIVGSIPAVCLPSHSMTGVCATGDSSEVPAAFLAGGMIQVTSNGATTSSPVTMVLESAYFDPFGDAITLTSIGNSIVIVTNYTRATIDWSNVVDMGTLTGLIGSTAISGYFQQFATEHENLVSGTAQDSGTLSLGITDNGNQIDVSGRYTGNSSIPHTGSSSCGFACTETGFQDSGSFRLHGASGTMIVGTYATSWSVPAFGFESSVEGQVIQA